MIQGFLYDLARGSRGDVEYIGSLMRRLSGYGYNMLILNLEYRFDFPSHPSIGPVGSLRTDDIKYLDKTAKELGIELVPFMNCAGHFEGICVLEKYKNICVDEAGMTPVVEQLKVGHERSLRLIKELYSDLFSCFSSKYFHIGGDEIRRLAEQMPELNEEERWNKALQHVLAIINFLDKSGKIPMMWGDMLLKHKDCISSVPNNVIICDWYYYVRPNQRDDPGNMESQQFFKESKKSVLACPAVSSFHGHPVISINSTENIKVFTKENQSIKGCGTILCTWETNFGGFFSSCWPWVYLHSEVSRNRTIDGMSFLREYTKKEWGLDTTELMEWYDIVDVQVQKLVSHLAPRPFIMVKRLHRKVFRTNNILAVIYDAKSWLAGGTGEKLKALLLKARGIATSMYHNSRERKEEPLRLRQWNDMFLSIVEIARRINKLEKSYNRAAQVQGLNTKEYFGNICKCIDYLNEILEYSEVLHEWSKTLVKYENQVDEEKWWMSRARKDIKNRILVLEKKKSEKEGLINFNLFITRDPDIPNRVINK